MKMNAMPQSYGCVLGGLIKRGIELCKIVVCRLKSYWMICSCRWGRCSEKCDQREKGSEMNK